jgi:hypothetical protein
MYILEGDEKTTPVMLYLGSKLVYGELISKDGIRVHSWLRSPMVPEQFHLLNAKVIQFAGHDVKQFQFPEIYVPIAQILAYHVLPPATKDMEMDYDPNEPNRIMRQVTIFVSRFNFAGERRISKLADFTASLAAGAAQAFEPLYNVIVSHPTIPNMSNLKVPYVLIRSKTATFALRED